MSSVKGFTAFFLALGLVLVSIPAFAQSGSGTLTGQITDQSSAVVPGGTVTVTNVATNESHVQQSDTTGFYRVVNLQPGKYSVKVAAQGFKTTTQGNVEVTVGAVVRIDVKLEVGAVTQTVTVEGAAPLVNTEQGRLSELVGENRIQNMPLNGRNIYDLVKLAPGAVDVRGANGENGAGTSANGARVNFNGFLLDGVANKGLSGGFNSQPNPDMVQEFRVETNNLSAEFGNSAGAITQVVTKSGTNALHGSVWEYLRNDKLDANDFFNNKGGVKRQPLRVNQFGASVGGPIKKDKTFFFASWESQRVRAAASNTYVVETPEYRNAVATIFPNSVAALIYKNFPFKGTIQAGTSQTVNQFLASANGFSDVKADYTDPDTVGAARAAQFNTLFRNLSGTLPMLGQATLAGSSFVHENFVNGNQYSIRIDHNFSDKDRFSARWTYAANQNPASGDLGLNNRGFGSPFKGSSPNGGISWTHVFSPNLINEFRAGYSRGVGLQDAAAPGVPSINFDDGTLGFGAYNGYPQFFTENIFNYQDLVSLKKGKHNLKMGFEYKRNQENSEFNVGRAAYYFADPFFFATDNPYGEAGGTNPGVLSGVSSKPPALSSNIRGWRNREWGTFIQDDWKVTPRLTLNLGLRYDLYERHKEKYGLATQFIFGPGNDLSQRVRNAGGPLAGKNGSPGGFAAADVAGNSEGDHNNFGPRASFAWDPYGKGTTAIRGGFGVSYESTFYNAISNSRWNPPYYNFASLTADIPAYGGADFVYYGPGPTGTPSYTGAPGIGNLVAPGNIMGYDPRNVGLQALLTGIPNPHMRDPYVESYFLGVEKQLAGSFALKMNYVGSSGHKIFRAESINRMDGGKLFRLLGDRSFSSTGRLNPNFGRLRMWENSVNSNYNSLQTTLVKRLSRGLEFNINYTWSHSIDEGSTWHSGATTANGAAAGDGYTSSVGNVRGERADSVFDIRHRFTATWLYELPSFKGRNGVVRTVFGGGAANGLITAQTGNPFSVYNSSAASLKCGAGANLSNYTTLCTNTGGDYNLDNENNDRPNAPSRTLSASGASAFVNGGWMKRSDFGVPTVGRTGNMGRNTFRSPGRTQVDFVLAKHFKFGERYDLQFRSEFFNIFNHLILYPVAVPANRLSSSQLGQSTRAFAPREIQFGLKLGF